MKLYKILLELMILMILMKSFDTCKAFGIWYISLLTTFITYSLGYIPHLLIICQVCSFNRLTTLCKLPQTTRISEYKLLITFAVYIFPLVVETPLSTNYHKQHTSVNIYFHYLEGGPGIIISLKQVSLLQQKLTS